MSRHRADLPEDREVGHSHVRSAECRPEDCTGHPHWEAIQRAATTEQAPLVIRKACKKHGDPEVLNPEVLDGRGVLIIPADMDYERFPDTLLEEPGIWAVVVASCVHAPDERTEWCRFSNGNWYRLGTGDTYAMAPPDDWDSLLDAVLVREGIEP